MLEYSYHREPTPHICFPQLLPKELYEQITFPEIRQRSMGRSGRDLFMGEPGFERAVSSVGLRDIYSRFCGSEFVSWVLSIFEQDLVRLRCRTRADSARLVPYLETREELDSAPEVLDAAADPSEVFNRFDFSEADSNYTPYVHLDSPRRVVGGLLFFTAAKGIDGGNFVLYKDRLYLGDRVARWPHPAKTIPPTGNTGVVFLNANCGFHGPSELRAGTRKWVYYSISSRSRAWEPATSGIARAAMTKIAGRTLRRVGIARLPLEPKSKLDANRR